MLTLSPTTMGQLPPKPGISYFQTILLSALQVVERFFQFSLLGMLASGYAAVLGSGVV